MTTSLSAFQLEILKQARSDMLSFAWIESEARDMLAETDAKARLLSACHSIVDLAESGLVVLGSVDFNSNEALLCVNPYPVPMTQLRSHICQLVDSRIQRGVTNNNFFSITDEDAWLEISQTGRWVSSRFHT